MCVCVCVCVSVCVSVCVWNQKAKSFSENLCRIKE